MITIERSGDLPPIFGEKTNLRRLNHAEKDYVEFKKNVNSNLKAVLLPEEVKMSADSGRGHHHQLQQLQAPVKRSASEMAN